MMYKSIIHLILLFTVFLHPPQGYGQDQDNPYNIKGQLMDGESDQPMPFAQVALYEPRSDSPVFIP